MKNSNTKYREILKLEDIKTGIFIKRHTNIYLVKDFTEDIHNKYKGKYRIEYFFRISTKTLNPKLHIEGFDTTDIYELNNGLIKKPIDEEIQKLQTLIYEMCPRFDFNTLSYKESKRNIDEFSIENCIEFLKNKGYIVLKQV